MPRPLRVFLTVASFALFFGMSVVIGLLLFPILFLMALGNLERHRERCTRWIAWGYGTFILHLRLLGLVSHRPIEVPEGLKGKPYIVVANHPTFIDLIYLLHYFPGLTCVVKSSWYRKSIAFGPLLRSTNYVPGPGYPGDDVEDEDLDSRVLARMAAHIESGHPLLIFPEGTRSAARRIRRFKRGAFELAKRTGVPLVPVVVRVDRPFLMKGVPFWKVPEDSVRFEFDVLPVIDSANDPRDGRELRSDCHREFDRRFSAWVEERERRGYFPAAAEAEATR
ncbi:MAG: lysophospholipid acyltransferase family protein [Myxococcota bacterium]